VGLPAVGYAVFGLGVQSDGRRVSALVRTSPFTQRSGCRASTGLPE